MKSLIPILTLAAAAFTAGCQTPAAYDAQQSRVTVNFENPEKFTDLKADLTGGGVGEERMQSLFKQMVVEEASGKVREGQKLTLTFTDVDLAGDYLPSASSGHDIRVVKEIYPPRQRFKYSLTDSSGAVVKEGEAKISDNTFQFNINPIGRNEELHYDRELFRDWVRDTLSR